MRHRIQPLLLAGATVTAFGFADTPRAAELYDESDLVVRWDNTLRYSAAFRLAGRDPALLANINGDDGDRNFAPGLISNRVDLSSRIDLSRDGFGLDASADAWYDSVYQQRNDNDSPATFNPVSVPHNSFTAATKSIEGRRAELADAFVYGATELGRLPFSFRIGRQTLLWGESQFFPENGIAGAQSPIDESRGPLPPGSYAAGGSGQGAYASGYFLPVGQVSASLGLPDGLTLDAYWQFEWRADRLPGTGSYFSTSDVDPGGERYFVGPGSYLYAAPNRSTPASGQYGAALRFSAGDVDWGLYALRYNAKDPQLYYRFGSNYDQYGGDYASSLPSGRLGTYQRVYAQGIGLFGASASFNLGDTSLAGELSGRRDTPLQSRPQFYAPGQEEHPPYVIGDTLNGDFSSNTGFARTRLWDSATLSADLAARWRLAVAGRSAALDPSAKDVALAFRAVFEPTYFEVLPQLDLTFQVGVGWAIAGSLTADPYQSQGEGSGDLDFGVTAKYRVVWSASVAVVHFVGRASEQPFADRDFLSVSVQRTF